MKSCLTASTAQEIKRAPLVGPFVDVENETTPGVTATRQFLNDLRTLVQAHAPIVHIGTHEEDRCLRSVRELAGKIDRRMIIWSASQGCFTPDHRRDAGDTRHKMADLAVAIELFEKCVAHPDRHPGGYIFVLLDPYPYLSDKSANPVYRRKLRDFAIEVRTKGRRASCLIISPVANFPVELEKEITVMDFPLPDRSEVTDYLTRMARRLCTEKTIKVDRDPELIERMVDATLGLTQIEIDNSVAQSIVKNLSFSADDVDDMFKQKQQIIAKNGLLEYVDTRDMDFDQIGGLAAFKEWLRLREAALTAKAAAFGIEPLKGVLLAGVPGCGKSWSAKCVAAAWHLPLIRLDMGRIYSSLLGSSEENLRDVIKTVESIAPCILWLDEIEKAMPQSNGFNGDSGVSQRIMGQFLTWMQEKRAQVFVFATANQTDVLPPEIMRKGRFDEVFFVDLPNDAERREIIEIQLRHIKRMPERFDIGELVYMSGPQFLGEGIGLTGAEIAAWANEALIHAFDRIRGDGPGQADLAMEDFREVARKTVPLAQMRSEEIRAMREWAALHAKGASGLQARVRAAAPLELLA